jgi:hypothetical protein
MFSPHVGRAAKLGKVELWEVSGHYSCKKWYRFTNRHNPAERYDEFHLAWDTGVYFEEIGRQNGRRSYRKWSNPVDNVTVPSLSGDFAFPLYRTVIKSVVLPSNIAYVVTPNILCCTFHNFYLLRSNSK